MLPVARLSTVCFLIALLPNTSGAHFTSGGRARGAQPTDPPGSARWIARQVQDRDTGRDGRLEMRMRLFDSRGRARDRALELTSLRGGNKGAPAGDRLLIRFTYPNDIKGTAFLVWEHPDAEDERFLYLPALGRVRRIAGEESQQSFVGTDFTYEDIGGREIEDYTYVLIDERASWKGPDGQLRPAYRLESRAVDRDAVFPRVVSLVLKDSFVVVHADVHNRRNELQKVYEVGRLDQIERIWTVMEAVMQNRLDQTRTELSIVSADYNVGLKEEDFTRRELERGAR